MGLALVEELLLEAMSMAFASAREWGLYSMAHDRDI